MVDSNNSELDVGNMDEFSNDDLFNINSWGADLSFRELISMYDENELLKPELQRKYVWEKNEASRFLESMLLGLPVPSIFLAKTKNEKSLIVDGYQRIMTVYDYVNGIFSKDGKIFKLSNSKNINKRWRNKAFNELDESDQRKIRNKTIHAIIFEQIHPDNGDTSLYQVFERINTTGRTLMPQEIRNCVYQGEFNSMLFRLNKYERWRELFGNKREDQRMRDLEMILRFFALSSPMLSKVTKVQISFKNFFSEYMGIETLESVNEIERHQAIFYKTMDFIYENIGVDSFKGIGEDGNVINKFNPTIFDSISIAVCQALLQGYSPKDNLNNERRKLLANTEYIESTTIRTTNLANIYKRIELSVNQLFNTDDN